MIWIGINFDWELCVAPMPNAATKHILGIERRRTLHSPDMTELMNDIRVTICLVKDVKLMGTLLEALCDMENRQ